MPSLKEQKEGNFFEKNSNTIAVFLCLFSFFSTFLAVQGNIFKDLRFEGWALTSDEVSHIPAGYYYLTTRKYFINAEHPPLIKSISALPLLFLNLKSPTIPPEKKYENIQWEFGGNFLFQVGNPPDLISLLARSNVLILNTILLFFVYLFVKKNFNSFVALLFLFLIVFSPNFAGHSGLVTFDVPLSLFCILSLLFFASFLKNLSENKKKMLDFFLAVFFTSLALLTKFQALFLFLGMALGGFVYFLFQEKSLLKKYIFYLILFGFFASLFIGFYQGFFTQKMGKEGLIYQLGYSYPSEFPKIGKEILTKIINLNFWIFNGIVEYLIGILMMVSRVAGAWQSTYFLGNVYGSEGAGILYFPVLFLTKETLGFLFLLFFCLYISLSQLLKNRSISESIKQFFQNPFNAVSFFFFLVYLVFSLKMRLNIGVRHIFPIIFLGYLVSAILFQKLIKEKLRIFKKEVSFSVILPLCSLFIVLSYLSTWPYFLSYYNLFGGGTWEGYNIATDSNYDWAGQDIKKLAKWVKENKVEKIYVHIFSNASIEYYLGKSYQKFNIRYDPLPPSKSLLAVSAFEMQNVNYDKNLGSEKKYFQLQPYLIKRIGTTIFIFQIP